MKFTENEVIQFVNENDIKFVKLAFCDIFGTMKNISILSDELPRAFENGISFDASSIKGFMNIEESDLFLFPDPSTLSILPWRPQQGRVVRLLCYINHPDGRPFEGDGRLILKKAIDAARKSGYKIEIGPECEFYLFLQDEKGYPTKVPHDYATYLDAAPVDKGENVRREICLTLEQMGILPESSHHEQGPGQNEIDFKYSDAMIAADSLITFKSVVRTIANINGLHASFMPKPLKEFSGSGLHINISLLKNNINLFDNQLFSHTPESDSFIAGILDKIPQITLFLNPLINSYERFGSHSAPKYVTWSSENRSQLIRIPAANGKYSRIELRSPDPSCNPYLAFALLIYAGLDGIKNKYELDSPADYDLYKAEDSVVKNYKKLPATLAEAIENAEKSDFACNCLQSGIVEKYIQFKKEQWNQYLSSDDKESFEFNTYFYTV
ncbi:glutamine synthetase family protein [Sedimentibacter sp.]|uniref:glutamine synthetase family protein n=1 Tax=Sedimentibacter sp. TaxID=1960295 RepID=UPI0028AD4AC9|nr:glutamine synthetase family protein [Sedimentibacter sp.]